MSLKLNVEFDDYEKDLLRIARAELTELYKSKGLKPPSTAAVVRGLVRTGFIQAYGEEAAARATQGVVGKEAFQRVMEQSGYGPNDL